MSRASSLGGVWAGAIVVVAGLVGTVAAQEPPGVERTQDVIYGRKHGMALTLDVFQPPVEKRNGRGLIWVVSGGWFSAHEAINGAFVKPFTDHGYTVFAVVHGSQPRFTIPEILQDMHRAVRFIRAHAADYGIDPDRIGIYGGSAGGHLSLMQGLAPEAGKADAKDPVDRQSSRVAAVACFFPPTDFLNYGKPGENALGRGILEGFQAPFDFQEIDNKRNKYVSISDEAKVLEIGRAISPVNHATADDAPVLIHHGDADKLVPIQQAQLVVEALQKAGVEATLQTRAGGDHGWADMDRDLEAFAGWFDAKLGVGTAK
jgi:acetyl esterase/lipase